MGSIGVVNLSLGIYLGGGVQGVVPKPWSLFARVTKKFHSGGPVLLVLVQKCGPMSLMIQDLLSFDLRLIRSSRALVGVCFSTFALPVLLDFSAFAFDLYAAGCPPRELDVTALPTSLRQTLH